MSIGGVRQQIAKVLDACAESLAVPALLARLAEDTDSDVRRMAADTLERILNRQGISLVQAQLPRPSVLKEARSRLVSELQGKHERLLEWLQEQLRMSIDFEELRNFGTVLTQEGEIEQLPRAYGVAELLRALRHALFGPAPHAAVVLGEPGSGKTALIHELAHQLRQEGWHMVRVSPTDFMAGTRYSGEWETRVTNLVAAVRAPRKLVVYVPNLQDLSTMGTWSKSDASVASALAPHIECGDLYIVGESTHEAFRSGLGAIASLRRLFQPVEMPNLTVAETREVLKSVRDEAGVSMSEGVLDRLVELTDYFLAGAAQPGRSVGLLRRVLAEQKGHGRAVTESDVLATLSASTGIPADLLDDAKPMHRETARGFFEARIMGQAEAVDAILDLVTLIKAGLTDPGKPFGILLFVGPTGVGKTELARALAEYLFGDAGRLLRLDMSEFATFDAHERLIGWGTRPGLLTGPIRERPFSVVLLDEIEKAHANVFDLCLQVFDAGRLTDTQGRTVDFRRTIIILTSNLGAAIATDTPYGFGRSAPAAPDRESMLRELGRWFRPEFLNRLDRIVSFQPLAVETAERIARREVGRVLQRSGLARRKLAVDVDPTVVKLMLKEGYSPALGARPLKRTVERLLLLPLAKAITEAEVPQGSLVRIAARGQKVHVQIAPPEAPDGAAMNPAPTLSTPQLERFARLKQLLADLQPAGEEMQRRKVELLAESAHRDFWQRKDRARLVMDQIYRLDSVLARMEDIAERLVLEEELSQTTSSWEQERLRSLENEVSHLEILLRGRAPRLLDDAFVTVAHVARHGAALDGVRRLAEMYVKLARRRGFAVEVIDDHVLDDPHEDQITLAVVGPGGFALLGGETGLHHLTAGKEDRQQGRKRSADREVVRVEVLPCPSGESRFSTENLQVGIKPLRHAHGRLIRKPQHQVELFHRPTMTGLRAWCGGSKAEALDKLRLLLRARLEAEATAQPSTDGQGQPIIRRYTFGPAPLVRDFRTRRTTGRIDLVLAGRLDAFLVPPDSDARAHEDNAPVDSR